MEQNVYENKLSIIYTENGFVLVEENNHHAEPTKAQFVALPSLDSLSVGQALKVHIKSHWEITLRVDPNSRWDSSVKKVASMVQLPSVSEPVVSEPVVSESTTAQPEPTKFDFDEQTGRFFVEGKGIPVGYLTEMEHNLLVYLYQNRGNACSYRTLSDDVWGFASNNTISQTVYRLRKKLKEFLSDPRVCVKTCRGHVQGYTLGVSW